VRLIGKAGAWTARSSEVREPGGALRWRVEHTDWGTLGGVAMPGATRVTDGRTADLRIGYREREINVELRDGLFGTGAPPGIPVDEIDCN
jgi:hypothetical protein